MNDKAELTSISKFLDSKISFLLHKTKLKEIYSRPLRKFNVDFFAEDLSKRVSKNKKLSRERVEEQIMHFRNIDNRHMQQRLKGIQSRGNATLIDIDPLNEIANVRKNNKLACKRIEDSEIASENIRFAGRLVNRKSYIQTKKYMRHYDSVNVPFIEGNKRFLTSSVEKIGMRILKSRASKSKGSVGFERSNRDFVLHTEPTKEVDFIGDTDLRPTFQKGFLNREAAFENLKNKSFFSSSGSGFLVVNLPIVPNRIEKRSLNANLNKFSQLIY